MPWNFMVVNGLLRNLAVENRANGRALNEQRGSILAPTG
jgi:hypothetical protein